MGRALSVAGGDVKGIKPETIRMMKWAWSFALCAFSFPCLKACFTFPSAIPESIAFLILAPVLFSCFPLIGEVTERRQLQYATRRQRWKQQYKASSESRLMRLNDSE